MGLTPQQRAAGRAFRDECSQALASLNAADPPALLCSPWSPPFLRHDCDGPGGTRAMALRERHADSIRVRFTWLEGTCHHCGTSARSSSGYITILEESNA